MVGELLRQQFCRDPVQPRGQGGVFLLQRGFRTKSPAGEAGLIKSAPGGGSGTGGAEGESNISLDKLAANYTLVCGQSPSCRHPAMGPNRRAQERKGTQNLLTVWRHARWG